MRTILLSAPAMRAALTILLGGLLSNVLEGRAMGALARQSPGAGQELQGSANPSQPSKLGSASIFEALFQATVYEVQGPAERLGILDSKGLMSQASTPETLLAALTQSGKARLLYHFAQPVNVYSTRITVGASQPLISASRTTAGGQTVNNITYQNVGIIVRLTAEAPPATGKKEAPIVTTAFKLSVLSPGEKEITSGVKEVEIRALSLDLSKVLGLNRPEVLVAISSNAFSSFRRSVTGTRAGETPATPIAYVIWYEFSPLAPARAGETAVDSKASATEASKPAGLPPGMLETARSTNRLPIQFQASVYKVEAASNRLPVLDVSALQSASTPELFLRALNEAGKPRVMYRIDQAVNVLSDQAVIRTNVPIVTGVTSGPNGKAVNSYTSHSIGVSVRLSAQLPPTEAERETLDVGVSFNLSNEAPSDAEFGLGHKCMSFPLVAQEHSEPLVLGRSKVMLAMGSTSATGQVKPFVYVVRYQFGLLMAPGH